MSDLETLIPQAVELVIDGEPLAVKPLKVGQMPAFLRAITPVMQQIGGDGIDWLTLIGERGDDLLTAVSIAIGKPRAWVDELAADEAILLAAKVIEVNADFFTRTVMPRLNGEMGGLIARTSAAAAAVTAGSTDWRCLASSSVCMRHVFCPKSIFRPTSSLPMIILSSRGISGSNWSAAQSPMRTWRRIWLRSSRSVLLPVPVASDRLMVCAIRSLGLLSILLTRGIVAMTGILAMTAPCH